MTASRRMRPPPSALACVRTQISFDQATLPLVGAQLQYYRQLIHTSNFDRFWYYALHDEKGRRASQALLSSGARLGLRSADRRRRRREAEWGPRRTGPRSAFALPGRRE